MLSLNRHWNSPFETQDPSSFLLNLGGVLWQCRWCWWLSRLSQRRWYSLHLDFPFSWTYVSGALRLCVKSRAEETMQTDPPPKVGGWGGLSRWPQPKPLTTGLRPPIRSWFRTAWRGCSWGLDSQKLWEIIHDYYCSKPLSFGVICYASVQTTKTVGAGKREGA